MRIALPKGKLLERLSAHLVTLDMSPTNPRRYTLKRDGLLLKMLNAQDIPLLVASGDIDIGFVAEEWLLEHGLVLAPLLEMTSYRARIAAIVPDETTARTLDEFCRTFRQPLRIVTQYESITRGFLAAKGVANWTLRKVWGSAEAYIPEMADLVIDCVETGATLKANGLKILETIFVCRILLVVRPDISPEHQETATRFAQGLLKMHPDFQVAS